MAHALEIILTEAERVELERRARRRKIARGDAMRAWIVLLAVAGYANNAIARSVGATRKTVQCWRRRFGGIVLTASMTSHGAGRHARSAMISLSRS
jgi:transposase-like protein